MPQPWDISHSKKFQLPHPEYPHEGHTAQVYALQLRGSHVVSGAADKTVRVWNVDTQRLVRGPLEGHDGSVICLMFDDSQEQDVIISGGTDGSIVIWKFSTGTMVKKLEAAHDETVLSLAFNDRFLVTGSKDKKVKVWNRQATTAQGELPAFLPIETTSTNGTIAAYTLLADFEEHLAAVNCVILHGDWVLAGAGDRSIAIWDLQTGQLIRKIADIHQRGICDLEYDGRNIVSASSDETCRVYDLEQGTEIACLRGHTDVVRAVLLVPHGAPSAGDVITGGYDGYVRYWRKAASGQWDCQITLDTGSFQSLSGAVVVDNQDSRADCRVFDIGMDSTRLICAGQGPVIKMWDFSGP